MLSKEEEKQYSRHILLNEIGEKGHRADQECGSGSECQPIPSAFPNLISS